MGISYHPHNTILPKQLKPDNSVLIEPKNAIETIGRLNLFATERDKRPMPYMLETPTILNGSWHLTFKDFIPQILTAASDAEIPQFAINHGVIDGLKVVKVAIKSDRYSDFETIGKHGDRAVSLIFYQPQLMVTSFGQSLLVGTVGFLTLP